VCAASTARGRRDEDLNRDKIVEVTIKLLDRDGLDAFSMRTLATALGRAPMAAYRHVESRDALLLLAAEAAEVDPPDLGDGPWYDRLEALARFGWQTTWSVHPWLAELMRRGTAIGSPKRRQQTQAIYRDAGFDASGAQQAMIAHWSFMVGTLTVVTVMQSNPASKRGDLDAVFDFNLRTYISGIRAMADTETTATS